MIAKFIVVLVVQLVNFVTVHTIVKNAQRMLLKILRANVTVMTYGWLTHRVPYIVEFAIRHVLSAMDQVKQTAYIVLLTRTGKLVMAANVYQTGTDSFARLMMDYVIQNVTQDIVLVRCLISAGSVETMPISIVLTSAYATQIGLVRIVDYIWEIELLGAQNAQVLLKMTVLSA